jgi:hypothetical protein
MTVQSFVRRLYAVAAVGSAALSMLAVGSAAAQAPDVFVTVFAEHYVVNGRSVDDLDALESAIGAVRPGAVRLYACGDGTARAQLAAAHRFRDRYLELRVLDESAPQCRSTSAAAGQALAVASRAGRKPYGIDDVAVAQWWYDMMP